jgi:hypothetical protein
MMRSLVLVAALVALASAQAKNDGRVTVDKTLISVQEGFTTKIKFQLTQPFACPDTDDCSVIIKLTNSHPNDIAVDNCHVKWLPHQWHQPRFIAVSATEDFVDDKEKTFFLVTETAISNSDFYNGAEVPDIELRTAPRASASCHATGDPHYRSFDGHPFHIFPPGKLVFYKSLDPNRRFEMQTNMYSFNGRPAVHCAIAARENNDIVVISLCGDGHTIEFRRSCGSDDCKAGSFPRVGVDGGSNPRYTIDFASGVQIRANINYWSAIGRRYMNVYATAPGVDRDRTVGICGNNNGNPNDDVNVGHNAWIHNLGVLFDNQRVSASNDIFNFNPATSNDLFDVTPSLPPFAEECDYIDPKFIRPILNQPDVEDISDLLKGALDPEVVEVENNGYVVDDFAPLPPKFDFEDVVAICENLRTTQVAIACKAQFPDLDLDLYVTDCAEDLAEVGGDPDFLEVAVAALEADCADLGNRNLTTWELDNDGNPIEPSKDLQNVMCPTSNDKTCSGNGECVATKCVCETPFLGADCSVDPNSPPVVETIKTPRCDGRGLLGCEPQVSVFGSNFFNHETEDAKCKFGEIITDAIVLGSIEVLCSLPTTKHSGRTELAVPLSVSMDGGVTFSATNENTVYTWFDSICQVCDGEGCRANPESCIIDGQCFFATEADVNNICLRCNFDESTEAFTFAYDHAHECGPKFDSTFYNGLIVGSAKAGDIILTVNAVNPLVASDPTNTITYSLREPEKHFFNIDSETGEVSIAQDLVVTPDLHVTYHGSFIVVATDAHGNFDESNVHVDALLTNENPLFAEGSKTFSLPEDTAVGTVLGVLAATDADNGEFGALTYSFLAVEAGFANTFAVDETTGTVTLAQPLDFETKDSFALQLQARDEGGQFDSMFVNVDVTDVNEAPTDIVLSNSNVPENAAGELVGTLTAVDQDFADQHTFTFATPSDAFQIVDNKIQTSRRLDFETEKSFVVRVRAEDKGGLTFEKDLTITVTNVNERPSNIQLGTQVFSETQFAAGSILTEVTVEDPDEGDFVRCTLKDSSNGHFEIFNMLLVLRKPFDFETTNVHAIVVECDDEAGEKVEQSFTIVVTDANEAPSNVQLAQNVVIPEDAAVGTKVGTVTAQDFDADADTITFVADSTEDIPLLFSLGETTCASGTPVTCSVDVFVAAPLDFDASPTAPLLIKATDGNGFSGITELAVQLSNVNEPPTGISFVGGQPKVVENAVEGTFVGQLQVQDEDAGSTFISLVARRSAERRVGNEGT